MESMGSKLNKLQSIEGKLQNMDSKLGNLDSMEANQKSMERFAVTQNLQSAIQFCMLNPNNITVQGLWLSIVCRGDRKSSFIHSRQEHVDSRHS